MSCSSTSARPSCITPMRGFECDDWWSSLWLVHRGGGGDGAAREGGERGLLEARYPVARRAFTLDHHHVQNGYAHADPLRSSVYASRPILAQFEVPQVWKSPARMAQAFPPPIQFTAPPPVSTPRTSRTSSSSRVRVRPKSRRQKHGVCTVPPWLPVLLPHHLCSVNAYSAIAHAVHDPRIRTAQICLCKPLHTPVVPGSVRKIWCINDWECLNPCSRCRFQY